MTEVSIKQFAETLNLSVDRLLTQLGESGIKGKKPNDAISDEEKRTLLAYLKSLHGEKTEATPEKVTLRRKQTLNLSAGSGKRTVNVEVRKKRTYVKKAETAPETVVEEAIPEIEETVNEEAVATPVVAAQETPAVVEQTQQAQAEKKENPVSAKGAETDGESSSGAPMPPKEDHSKAAKKQKDQKHHESRKKNDGEDGLRAKTKKPPVKGRKVIADDDVDASGRRGGKGRKKGLAKKALNDHVFQKPTAPVIKEVKVPESITLSALADAMSVKSGEIIKYMMMNLGTMATINQILDQDTAMLIVEEMGHKPVAFTETTIEDEVTAQEYNGATVKRSPVVTIMGHVDHGKTSLLDYIRKAKVAFGEAGGITQHIGAYHVDTNMGGLTFIDTPGHAAFTAMRARGAKVTDVVVIVVAADDGVMPQTKEAIQHAKASGVGIVVAINKMDKESANPERVKQELVAEEVVPEEWGGDVQFVPVSAKTGMGVDELLDAISLQAEILELEAPTEGPVKGVVIESRLDKGRGPVATVLVQVGTLRKGDIALCGMEYGRVRALVGDTGDMIDEAGPSIPVEILGLSGVPVAGDEMITVESERKAREAAMFRQAKNKELKIARQQKSKLDNMFNKMAEGEIQNINIILKADVQGSIEAITDALVKLSNDEVKVNVIASGVGGITETDANLALASEALIFGFNVRADASAKRIIDNEGISLKYYSVIYEIVDEVKRAVEGKLAPDFREDIVGIADVRDVFKAPKIGAIAGCMIIDGSVKRNNPIRVLRENVVIYEGVLESLRRFKDDVNEVQKGMECGIGVKDYNDVRVGDQIECYERIEVKRTLD
ncbi:translation initiation factor IF-2 [Thiomicrorhabdus heinhorstiae]|uniref:Translation initiation factor IF-2 n=1 Tax=Thiomicrorhabdus heinhorstiae TaxID=2748010 RepID=A0ABS0BV61_9GAMM|nr:translation initiation factor IF-2 [Thiomicrorhabdus heinhorstiae]MBF6056960.1 translation initiation factor IF-2 [Thiomicrorhabdus heinhorstiae]